MKCTLNKKVLARLMEFLRWNEIANAYTVSSLLNPQEYDVIVEVDEKSIGVLSIYKLTEALTVRGNLYGLTRLLPRVAKLKGYWCYAILPQDIFIVRKFVDIDSIEEEYLMVIDREHFKFKPSGRVKVLNEGHLYQIPLQSEVPYGRKEITYLIGRGRVYGSFTEEDELASLAFIQDTSENVALIGGVYTKSEFRRLGYAKSCLISLINDLLNKYRVVGLTVRTDNIPAINLYKSLGFITYMKLLSFEVV